MEQCLEVEGRRTGVFDHERVGHFDACDAHLVREAALGTVRGGLLHAPRIVVPHPVRHLRQIQRVLGTRRFGFVVRRFQFPFIQTRESLFMLVFWSLLIR